MQMIRNQNHWGCLLASAAMVLDKHPDVLTELIGHDGSEIIFPGLPEPARRRGFHVQEIIECAHAYGYAVTPIDALPISTPNGFNEYPVPLGLERFKKHLNVPGIFTGRARKWGHACAWDGCETMYDPRGRLVSDLETPDFKIETFWRFDKIKSKK